MFHNNSKRRRAGLGGISEKLPEIPEPAVCILTILAAPVLGGIVVLGEGGQRGAEGAKV